MLVNDKGKETAVEKEQGIEILPGEHDELEASEMENISGGKPATTPPAKPTGTGVAIIAVLIS